MLELSRAEILDRFRKSLAEGNILLGVGAGTGITAKSAEAGGADIFVIYNSGRFRMAGRGSLQDCFPMVMPTRLWSKWAQKCCLLLRIPLCLQAFAAPTPSAL